MWSVKAVVWLSATILLLLIGGHEYIWFAAFQPPRILPFQRGDYNDVAECNSASCYKYYRSETAPYLSESWPDVDFDTGEFYSGSISIGSFNPNRNLFFIFKPAEVGVANEVVIWLNGGPGCSSLYGFTSENGPIPWQTNGTDAVPGHKRNPFAWSKTTNMLWVDQPVGTGFSQGEVRAIDIVDLAKEFADFFANWQSLLGIENYKIYLTVWHPVIWNALGQKLITFDCAGRVICWPVYSIYRG